MATTMIHATIDGRPVEVEAGTTIMQAAETIGIRIPRLCYHPKLSLEGACRICIVDVKGMRFFPASCATKVTEGMEITTGSPEIRQARRDIVELLLDNHPMDCQTCERDANCELQNLAYQLGVRERLFDGKRKEFEVEDSSYSIVRNSEKCVLCQRCVRVCAEVQGVHNLSQQWRGASTVVAPAFEARMIESICINCGQCINVCPTAAWVEKSWTEDVWNALNDPKKHVVVHIAPSIRAAIGEGFGLPPGTPTEGKTAAALRRLGFDKVFDTNFSADLTIVEESNEFLKRLQNGGTLPLITSCSPGWVKFMEHFYPGFIPNMSTCKSPMSMHSTVIKTYYAEKAGIDPKDIFVVAVMPCTAKKYESRRPEFMSADGRPDTDAVLTTRELIWMIKAYGIDFLHLADEEFDHPLGYSTGAADIFGTTGGVLEAALRTAVEMATGKELVDIEFKQVRGVDGLQEASLDVGGTTLKVAVANGLHNARVLLDRIKAGETFHMIEIMACPGGCVGGGGQPYPHQGEYTIDFDLYRKRAGALYAIDKDKELRKSHKNPHVLELYKDYLGEVGGHKAHELLHTHYQVRAPRGI
ncbi:MAG TPA: NADH-dependent [FeFe] hydrogenase, group A6 [Spirochaetota bacterium]|nr:NADH-dependent [FeFe] hydrogenase, group A6 [Spirochaetota bacterium]